MSQGGSAVEVTNSKFYTCIGFGAHLKVALEAVPVIAIAQNRF